MANSNAPRGMLPYQLNGQPKVTEYSIASGYNTSIGKGHVVELTGTGDNIQIAAAGNTNNLGVFMGVRYVDSQGAQHFKSMWPANQTGTDIKAAVVRFDTPGQVFEIQADTFAANDAGALVDWNAGTLDTVNGVSGLYADVGAGTSTTDMSLRILGLVDRVDNAVGAYAKIRVTVVESDFYAAGVGV